MVIFVLLGLLLVGSKTIESNSPAMNTMQENENRSIEEATARVKKRLPLKKIRSMPKYKDLTPDGYEKLIKDSETVALLILKAFLLKK
ncbi:hypothetical protein [uncultured Draconibacterium sp.]|uniref:hypothetical protein n=1 Tax=uncultured Draconibacterium sp. TaxID=1573823 RepID=UPI0025CC7DA9|nr:hypothetical protein [uncultured Draconibacterium sp.]